MKSQRELGVVGLGRMGGGLAMQAAEKGMRVVGVDRSPIAPDLLGAGVIDANTAAGLREHLSAPRAILVYVPAGPAVDGVLDELADSLEEGDVIADGGNSYWGDSIRRHERLATKGIELVDLGTSGGIEGARRGACFMAGGAKEAVGRLRPILEELAVAGGFVHAGAPGSGHFAKLVHNGIEFGMLQAIAEGVDLLEHYHQELPVADILRAWRHGSVIRSWLIDLMEQGYRERRGLREVPSCVEDTGEVNWLLQDAIRLERPTPVIAQAVMQLFASRDASRDWSRAVAVMRHGFGGHPLGEDERVRIERRRGRVGPIWRKHGPRSAGE